VGVTQGRPELNFAGTSAGTRLWKFTKPYSSNWLGLEAEVGIEHQLLSDSKHHNSQQHKPLRSFPNEINHLTRIA